MNRRQRLRRARIRRAAMWLPPIGLALSWLVGLLISPIHRESLTSVLPSTAETIWRVLTDLDGMPAWREDLIAVERLPESDGTIRWREQGRSGPPAAYEWVALSPPRRLVVRRVVPDTSRRWEYRIRPLETGSEVAVIEERAIRNPALRTLVKLVGSDRDRIESFARELAARLAGHRQRLALKR